MRIRTSGVPTPMNVKLGDMVTYPSTGQITRDPVSVQRFSNHEICADEIHPNYPYSGGPFLVRRSTASYYDGGGRTGVLYEHPTLKKPVGTVYDGTYYATYVSGMNYALPDDKSSTAAGYGAEAYSKFSPLKPTVSLSQFFYELKEAPLLFQFGLKRFKDIGNNYLNVQFGWKPFLSDLRSWFSSIKGLDKRIQHFRNNNAKGVRRGGTLFSDTSTTTSSGNYWPNVGPANFLISPGNTVITTKVERRCWFKAKYRYYIPGLDDERWGKLKAIQHLYDLDVSPSVLWNIMPWSWLIDWCSNAGSVIRNIQEAASDNLTSEYAYIMLSEISTRTINAYQTGTFTKLISEPGKPFQIYAGAVFTQEQKIRVAASPFGFGLSWDNFNLYQLSILAALGITKF